MNRHHLKHLTASTLFALGLHATAASADPTLELSGLIEAEFNTGKDHTAATSGDIVLATIELVFDARINDHVSAHLLLLHEDDDNDPPIFEEGFLTISDEVMFLNAGRMFVPFGNFSSHMITDSLTKELGETLEAALEVGVEIGGLRASVYAFNGEADKNEADSDVVDDFGISLNYLMETESMNLELGIGYLNNMAETDGLEGALITANTVQEHTPGLALHAIFNLDKLNIIAEYITATDDFNTADLGFNGGKARPSASNLEIAYALELDGREVVFALGHQTSADIDASALPESRLMFAVATTVADDVGFTVEYTQASDYKIADGGTGESGGMLTAQLAVEF